MTAGQGRIPRQPHGRLFLRFLRFGLLAWGGPVAQIAMIRHELVEEEQWITRERFNRVLAVYQVLPGPEATELCVYFGLLAGGRLGGLLGGLGFMLPGLLLMWVLSWLYISVGIALPAFRAAFAGCQAAVIALILRAIQRIGRHALTDGWLCGVAVLAAAAHLAGVHFLLTLIVTGAAVWLAKRQRPTAATLLCCAFLAGTMALWLKAGHAGFLVASTPEVDVPPALPAASVLFGSGLRAGLLTFGGAYTVIPFLQHDAVAVGGWMTNPQFLDGLALAGILPAPLVIFGTFVGYLGGGAMGALALTAGIFLPAFAFTLIGYDLMERLISQEALHSFLDGVTAGVVGLIAATSLDLLRTAITGWRPAAVFGLALWALDRWKAKAASAVVLAGAALLGLLTFR